MQGPASTSVKRSWLRGLACVLAVLAASPGARAEEIRLGAGDVLAVSFLGPVSQSFEVAIEPGGNAWFPNVGSLSVAGLPLSRIRSLVVEAYTSTSMPSGVDGTEVLLDPNHVSVTISSYRPVYVEGGLGRGVTVDYRPGLTLRQALVVAGSTQVENPTQQRLERSAVLATEAAQLEARIWRLQVMLGNIESADVEEAFADRPADVRRFGMLESDTLAAIEQQRAVELASLSAQIDRAQARLTSLLEQREAEEEGRLKDDQVVENMRRLSEQGLTVAARVASARRAALTSATRVLQLDVQIADARERIASLNQKLKLASNGDVANLNEELTEAMGRFQRVNAELVALIGNGAASLATADATVRILRDDGRIIDVAGADSSVALMPGDIITLRAGASTFPFRKD